MPALKRRLPLCRIQDASQAAQVRRLATCATLTRGCCKSQRSGKLCGQPLSQPLSDRAFSTKAATKMQNQHLRPFESDPERSLDPLEIQAKWMMSHSDLSL